MGTYCVIISDLAPFWVGFSLEDDGRAGYQRDRLVLPVYLGFTGDSISR